MLEAFTRETFEARIGDALRLAREGAAPLELVVEQVSALGGTPARDRRAAFSVVFRGPTEPLMPQRTYRVEHAGLGSFDLFLVPIGCDAEGVAYEAVFA